MATPRVHCNAAVDVFQDNTSQIIVHLDSLPTSRNIDVKFVADGHVVKQSTICSCHNIHWTRGSAWCQLATSLSLDLLPPRAEEVWPAIHDAIRVGRQTLSPSAFGNKSRGLAIDFPLSPESDSDSRLGAFLAGSNLQEPLRDAGFDADICMPSLPSQGRDLPLTDTDDVSSLLLDDFFPPSLATASNAPVECAALPSPALPSPPLPTPTPSLISDETASVADSPGTTADLDNTSQVDERPPENAGLRAKRAKRLQAFLESLRHAPAAPPRDAHNAVVEELAGAAAFDRSGGPCKTPAQLAAGLEKLGGDAGGARGFVYGLLSWEVFRREEERLGRAEHLSAIAASKAANRQMVETLHRRAKTRDWARDGRKAAKVVFDALRRRGPAERSGALLLLAATVSLDGMLKIAHFPATRAGFSATFAAIVEERAAAWRGLAARGYRTFDYEELLRAKGGLREG